ncbi:uveal autoantigen with coiled-coil domains and ankyrin repeats protein isoform X2 [Latimeria chalumnae]|uniref:uveal autoantigen with coiled-coil domains and ankyrin repeats protein isoform X2 n=1 Tax=Latimeria chalumnae TaxID=7897 RepID=UPI00313E9A44
MKSLKSRLKKHEITITNTDWNRYDEKLMKAVERGDVEKVSSALSKKGINPTKLNVEGCSAFHLAASKGSLDCLNAMLISGVDITATDAAGRNSLHLAARNGQSLCLQKLLQHNCPTENVDLQSRTALHDAVVAGCFSCVQLLCDHGASVNVKDMEGRTPLVLATQMCRPKVCELLIGRGADVNTRDKQNKTALMLGCEYSCKDAVDVLIKNSADVTLMDAQGHDSFYYARLSENPEVVALVKKAMDNTSKAKDYPKKGQQLQKELETENEDLKGKLRKIHQDQKLLMDKFNEVQQHIKQERAAYDNLQKEKEQLNILLTRKEKEHEESLKLNESLKTKLKSYEKTSSSLQPHAPSRSMLRPLELSIPSQSISLENDVLKKDLEMMRKKSDIAMEDNGKLQNELSSKINECKCLEAECKRVKDESDEQIKQLEDALNDVQKRMFESEGKVKHLQALVVALKDHLAKEGSSGKSQMMEELKEQLKDMKSKYEGASAEVGRLRSQIKRSETTVEELKKVEERMVEENKRLQKEMSVSKRAKEEAEKKAVEVEGCLKEMEAKLALYVPLQKFDNMKSLLTSAVDEKEKQVSEMEKEYNIAREEICKLQTDLKNQRDRMVDFVKLKEHEQLKSTLEHHTGQYKKEISELANKDKVLQKEVEKNKQEKQQLKQQLQELRNTIATQYVLVKSHEEIKNSFNQTISNLNRKVEEMTQKYEESVLETEQLHRERKSLTEKMQNLQGEYMPKEEHGIQVMALNSKIKNLKEELCQLNQKHSDTQMEVRKLISENSSLKGEINSQYVPQTAYEEVKTVLNSSLNNVKAEVDELKKENTKIQEECAKQKEENMMLKKELKGFQDRMQAEYISLKDHEEIQASLSTTVQDLQKKLTESTAKYERAQCEIINLHKEIEAQRKELDTIQECINSKFIPVTKVEEKQNAFDAEIMDVKNQLTEQTEKYNNAKQEMERYRQENGGLKSEILSMKQNLQLNYIPNDRYKEMERKVTGKVDELSGELGELTQKHTDLKHEKERLQGENAKYSSELLALQTRMQGEYILLEQFETMKEALNSTVEKLKDDLESTKTIYEQEVEKVRELQQVLERQKSSSVPLVEHTQMKEALEMEVAMLKSDLEKNNENTKQNEQHILKLQTEIQNTTKALREEKNKDVIDLSKYNSMRSTLEAQVVMLNEKLSSLTQKYKAMCEEALQAKKEELSAKDEKETLKSRSFGIDQEIKELKDRYDMSLKTISDLQSSIQESAKQIEAKDNKITELLNDVERLKQALNGLSQLTYTSGTPTKRHIQQTEVLQSQVKILQQQLADADSRHREVISIYRTHLLSAAEGHMDEDVQAALLQIIRMRQELVC